MPMLKPGLGRTHRAYLWSYSSSEYDELQTVIYDFAEGRGGVHAREFLGSWSGKLVCDDYSGYKALFDRGVIEVGCMAHARRKLHDLYANHRSEIAEEGLRYFAALYEIEREAREQKLDADGRRQLRQQRSKPIAEALRQWLTRQRGQVPDGSATRKAIDYSLGRWAALTRYLEDGDLPIDNNHIENRIRPVALGEDQLALCRISARRPARRRHHEPDPVSQAQRPRSVSLPQGRPRAPADAARQPHRGVAAASLGAALNRLEHESRAIGLIWPHLLLIVATLVGLFYTPPTNAAMLRCASHQLTSGEHDEILIRARHLVPGGGRTLAIKSACWNRDFAIA